MELLILANKYGLTHLVQLIEERVWEVTEMVV